MELFSIHCTTCRVRLKVKDESVIGDILACPKCGSMVQIVPPVGWKRPGESSAALIPLAAIAPQAPAPTASIADSQSAAIVPPILPPRAATAPPSAVATPTAAHVAAAPLPLVQTPAEAALTLHPDAARANISWRDAALARLKTDWPLFTGGLAAGVVLGAGAWLAIRSGDDAPDAIAAAVPRVAVAQASPASHPTAEPISPVAPPADQPRPADTVETIGGATPAPLAADSTEPAAQAPPIAKSSEPGQSLPNDATSAAAKPDEPARPAIKLDEVENRAVPADLSTDDLSAAEPASAADEPAADAAPPDTPVAREETASPGGDGGVLSEAEVQRRMSLALWEVKFAKVPLAQFVQFIADGTALRITIDDAALAKAGMKRSAAVSVQLSDTTAADALGAALQPLGLACVVREGRLVVTVAAASDSGK